MARLIIIAISMILLTAICVTAVKMRGKSIEFDLQDRAQFALVVENLPWAEVTMDGRDAIVNGEAPNQAAQILAEKFISKIKGVRRVENRSTLNGIPFDQNAHQTDISEEELAQLIPPGNEALQAASMKAGDKPSPLVALVSHERCQDNINYLLEEGSIQFESGSTELSTANNILLDELVRIVNTCPSTVMEVSGHTDNVGQIEPNITLSRKRAESVVSYLTNAGIAGERFRAVGYGSLHPVADNTTPEGRQKNRRIEVHIKPHLSPKEAH